jgi:uncharacterized YccA/Bax inhibitor family protein
MESRNPVFARTEAMAAGGRTATAGVDAASIAQLEQAYAGPSAGPVQTQRMTYNDVIMKTGMTFAVLLVGAGIGWFNPGLAMIGFIVGLVLGLVNAFKKEPSPALIITYAAFMGVGLGGISLMFQSQWQGIVQQAILGTLAVFGVALFAYRSGRIRVTPKFQRMVLIGMMGYLAFSLINVLFMVFGSGDNAFGLRSGWMGIAAGLIGVALAAFSLVLDFDFIDKGVQNGIPVKYAWTAAFGLVVTLVWLYLELLRLIAIFGGQD